MPTVNGECSNSSGKFHVAAGRVAELQLQLVKGKTGIEKKIGVFGFTENVQAFVSGIIDLEFATVENIHVWESSLEKKEMAKSMGLKLASSTKEIADQCGSGLVLLDLDSVTTASILQELRTDLPMKTGILVSFSKKYSIRMVAEKLNPAMTRKLTIMRLLPSATATHQSFILCHSAQANKDHVQLVQSLAGCIGSCSILPEHFVNTADTIASSVSAMATLVMEGMVDAAGKVGLPWNLANQICVNSFKSTLEALTGASSAAQVRQKLCSPGSEILTSLAELEKHRIRYAFIEAMESVSKGAKATGEGLQCDCEECMSQPSTPITQKSSYHSSTTLGGHRKSVFESPGSGSFSPRSYK